jgi:hypothetical protein
MTADREGHQVGRIQQDRNRRFVSAADALPPTAIPNGDLMLERLLPGRAPCGSSGS